MNEKPLADWELAIETLSKLIASQTQCDICSPAAFKKFLLDGGLGAALPIDQYDRVRALTIRANKATRISVSLVLPLRCEIEDVSGADFDKRDFAVIIVNVLAKLAFEFLTTFPVHRPARMILKENGLTLQDLARRENLRDPN